ncbi:MAG: STAS domain-containing protein [Candidatus Eisenbacteria bacterium]|uniref:Anti-sigma factor antagonist n=1 Tax=Eiseniibacteriota bacterium TaxID=2212470 RepID=A0A538SFY0_UNCEI|nr:MAG: STAS domain-containing protein [Candidatus Eisenbacteria bacterium]TMQ58000.1 MAG: STAS domain-containing protein [Candidatus Eisenbacteria bacterium]
MLEIDVQPGGCVRLSGRLDAAQADRAKEALQSLNEPTTIDLTDLDYVSSAGLGVLVQTYKRLRDSGHSFRITNMKPRIRSVFVYAGLDKVLRLE